MCRDNIRRLQYSSGDYSILIAKTLAIREAGLENIAKRISNVITESDSQNTMEGEIKTLSQISKLFGDIKFLAKAVKDIKFLCRSRSANKLADRIARKAHHCNRQTDFYHE